MLAADDKTDASREATDWLIRLQDAPEDAELQAAFEAWLVADADNMRVWQTQKRVYDLMAEAPAALKAQWPDKPLSETVSKITPAPRRSHSVRARGPLRTLPRKVMAVVSVAAAACVMMTIAPDIWLRMQADAVTATAQTRTVNLPDGSQAVLAPDSALKIAYGDGRREVRLLRGQAWFDVQPDPQRPFEVRSGKARTTVLGTAFNVRHQSDDLQVAVERGHVQVSYGAAWADLRAGQWVEIDADGQTRSGTQPVSRTAMWKNARIVARDRTVADTLEDIRPWYSGHILITRSDLSQAKVTGVYDTRDPEAAVRAVVSVYGGKVHRVTPWLMIIS
ncbi:MAG: FecR domain-containing protein [Asticcacaulis sp.]